MSDIFIGDIDEFTCTATEGENRWAVWANEKVGGRVVEKLLGVFATINEAVAYAKTQGYKEEDYEKYDIE